MSSTFQCAETIEHLFEPDLIVSNFSSLDRKFPSKPIPTSDQPSGLPHGPAIHLPDPVKNWIKDEHVTSLIVLKHRRIVHESYHRGTQQNDLRMSWSVAKSILSALFGILHHKGLFGSLDTLAAEYVPTLSQSAYGEVTLNQLLQMTSGVTFDEDYHSPGSDIRILSRYLGRGGGLDAYVAARRRHHAEPGSVWAYSSLDTQVLGMVIGKATGQPVSDLLSREIIAPLGCETQPKYLTDARGVPFVLGGITMRSRDFARFGQMMADYGAWNGIQIVPKAWALRPEQAIAPTLAGELGYSDQWWLPVDAEPGEFMACGIYGQCIYINRAKNCVCVTTSANRRFSEDGVFDRAVDVFRTLAETP